LNFDKPSPFWVSVDGFERVTEGLTKCKVAMAVRIEVRVIGVNGKRKFDERSFGRERKRGTP
jgi:hypothetical protein